MRRLAASVVAVAALAGCGGASGALARQEQAARRSGLTCWVERDPQGDAVYCGDPALAPVGPAFVRWVR